MRRRTIIRHAKRAGSHASRHAKKIPPLRKIIEHIDTYLREAERRERHAEFKSSLTEEEIRIISHLKEIYWGMQAEMKNPSTSAERRKEIEKIDLPKIEKQIRGITANKSEVKILRRFSNEEPE